jgi:hypothetical protein
LPLPFAPLERTISLTARAGVLRDMPALVAARVRSQIAASVIGPAIRDWPWLAGQLRLL